MYVVTFAQPLPDGTYNVRDLRHMSLLEARALVIYAWPRRGTIVNIINGHAFVLPERVAWPDLVGVSERVS